ncbi:MAG: amidohydrolase family protein, partial [Acidimicrobiaceae bacterium]|nr:amidohydrolase family protein [Acidimicrobiaceae bacterium]
NAGARVATHLGNAMAPMHQREPGPLLALLDDPRVVCEVINDGRHVHPAFVEHVRRSAGSTRTALITDATAPAGLGDGRYRLGRQAVTVVDGMPRIEGTDVLAGSTLTLDAAFRRAVVDCGFSLPEAVAASSTTPATLLGCPDLGDLRPGARADLVVLDAGLSVTGVMARGEWVSDTRTGGPP